MRIYRSRLASNRTSKRNDQTIVGTSSYNKKTNKERKIYNQKISMQI